VKFENTEVICALCMCRHCCRSVLWHLSGSLHVQ